MEREHNHNEKVMYMLGEIKNQLGNIEIQTTKTNGRINKLEEKTEVHDRFIDGIKAKVALVSGMISLVGFVIWEFIRSKYFK